MMNSDIKALENDRNAGSAEPWPTNHLIAIPFPSHKTFTNKHAPQAKSWNETSCHSAGGRQPHYDPSHLRIKDKASLTSPETAGKLARSTL